VRFIFRDKLLLKRFSCIFFRLPASVCLYPVYFQEISNNKSKDGLANRT